MKGSHKRSLLVLVDFVLLATTSIVSASMTPPVALADWSDAAVFALAGVGMLWSLGGYRAILSHIEPESILDIVKAVLAAVLVLSALHLASRRELNWQEAAETAFAAFTILTVLRVVARTEIRRRVHRRQPRKVIGIYGAGAAGLQVASALQRSLEYKPVVFFDDDPTLRGRTLHGLPVRGTDELSADVARYELDEVLLAIPSADRARRRSVLMSLQGLAVRVKSIPSMNDIVMRRAPIDQIDDVGVEDLLGRDPVSAGQIDIAESIRGKAVLVTGAGGSIGSELCRQVLLQRPSCLVLLEISEAALYSIHHTLLAENSFGCTLVAVLGNIRDEKLVRGVLAAHRVEAIFHAAAYKHVHLVENNVLEALRNNAFGTAALVDAAIAENVASFLLISTDKAVRPTNIMGASKRLAELVIQARSLQPENRGTKFCIVRFGNVLGSSGSVVPLFRRQVQSGGPVTVTHPEVTRYFMTIPEAVQLVLQANVLAQNGDVCVLDMGEPVKILDVARKVIRLSGFAVRDAENPGGDIEIEFVGLRPGEKLHEELLIGSETYTTLHPKIMRAREDVIPWPEFAGILGALRREIDRGNVAETIRLLERTLGGYRASASLAQAVDSQATG